VLEPTCERVIPEKDEASAKIGAADSTCNFNLEDVQRPLERSIAAIGAEQTQPTRPHDQQSAPKLIDPPAARRAVTKRQLPACITGRPIECFAGVVCIDNLCSREEICDLPGRDREIRTVNTIAFGRAGILDDRCVLYWR
jgi:hypothetical protein